jgi:hypothetical protein
VANKPSLRQKLGHRLEREWDPLTFGCAAKSDPSKLGAG